MPSVEGEPRGLKVEEREPPLTISLEWSPRVKETAISVFLHGMYPEDIQALLEFADNSFGYRDREDPFPTIITVTVAKNRINVTDYGGFGADAEGIRRFGRIGETEDVGIGYRGAGAKYAAWFWGEKLEINAKRAGEVHEYRVEIPNFGTPTVEYAGEFPIKRSPSRFPQEKGRFEIAIRSLHSKRKNNLPTTTKTKGVLAEVYRPLLTRQKVDTRTIKPVESRLIVTPDGQVQEVNDKVVLYYSTGKRRSQVMPLEIPLLEGYSDVPLEFIRTNREELVWFWAGEMDLRNPKSKKVKSGIRFYYDGRLLNIDYCGFDEKNPRLASLVGEAHLENIEGIKDQLTVNKSVGINTNSDQWKRVEQAMHVALEPFVKTLEAKPIPIVETKPAFASQALARARRLADLCLRTTAEEGIVFSQEDLSILMASETRGQKPALPGPERERERKKPEPRREGTPWPEQKARTPAPENADSRIPRIRKSFIDGADIRKFDDPTRLSVLVKEKDSAGRERKIFILNSSHPLTNAAYLIGELALTQLAGQELCLHAARECHSNLDDFLRLRDALLYHFSQLLIVSPEYRRLEVDRFQQEIQEKTGKRRRR